LKNDKESTTAAASSEQLQDSDGSREKTETTGDAVKENSKSEASSKSETSSKSEAEEAV